MMGLYVIAAITMFGALIVVLAGELYTAPREELTKKSLLALVVLVVGTLAWPVTFVYGLTKAGSIAGFLS